MAIEVSSQSVSSAVARTATANVRQSQSSAQSAAKGNVPDQFSANTEKINGTSVEARIEERQQLASQQKLEGQKVSDPNSVVTQLIENVQNVSRQLEFKVDETSGRTIIKVKDSQTGEIIREIPSEEIVRIGNRIKELAESLHGSSTKDELKGLLLERRA